MMIVAALALEARINIGKLDEIGESLTCTKALHQACTKKWQEVCRSEILQLLNICGIVTYQENPRAKVQNLERGSERDRGIELLFCPLCSILFGHCTKLMASFQNGIRQKFNRAVVDVRCRFLIRIG